MNADSYRFVANIYDRIFEPLNRGLRGIGIRMLPPEQGMKVLDVGCGTGVHLNLYRNAECDVYGIDNSPSMLDVARKRLGAGADLRLGDIAQLPYDDGQFELVLCMLVLHEMDQLSRMAVIAEMKRVIKPNGHILLIDFHAGHVTSMKGWFTKPFVFLSEVAAGRRHFRNYRHFMSIGGLPHLIEKSQLKENFGPGYLRTLNLI